MRAQHEREAVRLRVRERVPPGHGPEAGDVLRVAAVRGARAVPGAQVRRARGGPLVARRHPLHARLRQPALRRLQPPRTPHSRTISSSTATARSHSLAPPLPVRVAPAPIFLSAPRRVSPGRLAASTPTPTSASTSTSAAQYAPAEPLQVRLLWMDVVLVLQMACSS